MKAIKFTKAALEKLKHTNKTYRVQDQQTVGLSIEVRATPSKLDEAIAAAKKHRDEL